MVPGIAVSCPRFVSEVINILLVDVLAIYVALSLLLLLFQTLVLRLLGHLQGV
jgi:hypothetical protein